MKRRDLRIKTDRVGSLAPTSRPIEHPRPRISAPRNEEPRAYAFPPFKPSAPLPPSYSHLPTTQPLNPSTPQPLNLPPHQPSIAPITYQQNFTNISIELPRPQRPKNLPQPLNGYFPQDAFAVSRDYWNQAQVQPKPKSTRSTTQERIEQQYQTLMAELNRRANSQSASKGVSPKPSLPGKQRAKSPPSNLPQTSTGLPYNPLVSQPRPTPQPLNLSTSPLPKLNLRDLLRLDEIFGLLLYEQRALAQSDYFDLISAFFSSQSSFLTRDLSLLFPSEASRIRVRQAFLYEILFFTIIVLLFADSQGIQSQRELQELLTHTLNNVYISFILRAEMFLDKVEAHFQERTHYIELRKLVSRRKSIYGISPKSFVNLGAEANLAEIGQFLGLAEKNLRKIFGDSREGRIFSDCVVDVASRRGGAKGWEVGRLLEPLGIKIDDRGVAKIDKDRALTVLRDRRRETNRSDRGREVDRSDKVKEIDRGREVDRSERPKEYSTVEPPFLRTPAPVDRPYTLVLDLDETLIHYPDDSLAALRLLLSRHASLAELRAALNFRIRPYCLDFLRRLRPAFELVVFTAASKGYADLVLDKLDPSGLIDHRLYHQHTTQRPNPSTPQPLNSSTPQPAQPKEIKDLSLIGRDLRKVIILDNLPQNFSLQPENGVRIQSWTGDPNDRSLAYLCPFFLMIAEEKPDDVRVLLRSLAKMLQGRPE